MTECGPPRQAPFPFTPFHLSRFTPVPPHPSPNEGEASTERLLLSHPPLTLGQLAHVLQREAALCQAIDSLGSGGSWFVTEWPPQLGEWATHRNAASHTGTGTKRQALSLRNRLLGVGCEGVLGRVVGVG